MSRTKALLFERLQREEVLNVGIARDWLRRAGVFAVRVPTRCANPQIRRPALLLTLLLCNCSGNTAAENAFSGRWRVDTRSFKDNIRPTSLRLGSDGFKKDDDEPVIADGQFHKIRGDGYVDQQSISIENNLLIKEVDKLHNRVVYMVDYVISSDGNTLTTRVVSFTSPNGQSVRGQTVYRRKGKGEAGKHLITGEWERASVTVDEKSDWILRLRGDHFSWRTEGGVGYDAKIGGASVKIDGDGSGSRAIVTMPTKDVIVETDLSEKGNPEAIMSMRLLADQNTIFVKTVYSEGKSSTTFYLRRVEN
jgi:hypothetical protein